VFGHWWELALVLILALVIFGPKRLPEIGSSMGKGIREFRKATSELEDKISGDDHSPGQIPPATEHNAVKDPAQAHDVKEA
jgi:sec-independent protein translocase protein TatA